MLSAVAFALAAGIPRDARNVVHVDPQPGPGGRQLLVSVEPLESNARGFEVAALALATLRETFAEAAALPAAAALGRAFAAANAAVLAENRPATGCCWDRRAYVGAVAIVVEGRDLTIAQVPPSQAAVVQDGRLYAFPDLASWRGDYVPPTDAPAPDPLGYREGIRPDMFHSVAAPGDLVLLCSTTLARCLGRAGGASFQPAGPPPDVLRRGQLAAVLDRLERLVVAHDLDDVHAAAIVLGRPTGNETARSGLDWATARTSIGLSRVGEAWSAVAPRRPAPSMARPRPTSPAMPGLGVGFMGTGAELARVGFRPGRPGAGWRRAALATVGIPLDRGPAPAGAGSTAAHERRRPRDDGQDDTAPHGDVGPGVAADSAVRLRPDAGGGTGVATASVETARPDAPASDPRGPLGVTAANLPPVLADGATVGPRVGRARTVGRLQLALVGISERFIPRRRMTATPPVARRRVLAAPGAASVRCYREQRSLPAEWRARLPRGPMIRVPGRTLALVLVLLLTFGTSGVALGRQRDRAARAESYLAAVDDHLQAAADEPDTTAADDRLGQAEEALAGAARNGADGPALAPRQQTLETLRDRARGVIRLTDVVRIGALPPALASGTTRLARAGSEVYLVGGGFYRLDPTNRQLVQLLAPGTRVGGGVVGELHEAAADEGGVVATDGAALYALNPAGGWARRPLGLANDQTPWPAAPCGAFQGSFYAIEPGAGRLLKFSADDLDASPEDWASVGARDALRTARDLAIDGRIHILLADGRVLSFLHGVVRGELAPAVIPAVTNPIALYGGPDTNFLYIAEPATSAGSAGRILRLDPNGDEARQFLLPIGADPATARALADVRDLVVDEPRGAVYFLAGGEVWRAALPALPAAA